jgi:multimeric flavodoxin WrbA
MNSDTAPYVIPNVQLTHEVETSNFDIEKINLFNNNIEICSKCENCFNKEDKPFCSVNDLPLSVSASKESCPIGKW